MGVCVLLFSPKYGTTLLVSVCAASYSDLRAVTHGTWMEHQRIRFKC